MGILRILYWALAYTSGIGTMTLFLLRWIQKKQEEDIRMVFFLLSLAISIASLPVYEGFNENEIFSSLGGWIALLGAALSSITFPDYAYSLKKTTQRRRVRMISRILGTAVLILTLLSPFTYNFFRLPVPVNFMVLGFSVFLGMSWISRTIPRKKGPGFKLMMVTFFIFFAAVLVFDFLKDSIPPFKIRMGESYNLFPAFYIYLNVILFTQHLKLGIVKEDHPPDIACRLAENNISSRESEVLALLERGLTYREIADELCISLATVKTHTSRLYEKTGTRNKVELINLLYD